MSDVQGLAGASSFGMQLAVGSDSTIGAEAERNRTALIRAYEALTRGDTDAWWALFDAEVEFHEAESLPYGQSTRGLEAARGGMGDMFNAWRSLDTRFEQFLAAGDLVIAYLQMTATSRKTGKVYSGPVAELFRFRNGRVVEWRPIYWDTHKVREVCGA